jgi:hypothetical protein
MKIVAGIQCYNEEDFIRECILSLYSFCSKIIITEGCWDSGIKSGKSARSSDSTIDYIKSIPDPLNKIKLYHFNGKAQVDHRYFTLEKAKQHNPDWYINGDGDEIFHEKEIDNLIDVLKSGVNSVNPTHKLFWNGLEFYEEWKPMGRFFKLSNLNLNKVKTSKIHCNHIDYPGNIFSKPLTPKGIYIYHPSYSKSISRQKFKIEHRTIDNKKKFPHYIKDNLIIRGNQNLNKWIKSLKRHEKNKLPKYLQDHKSCGENLKFNEFIQSQLQNS